MSLLVAICITYRIWRHVVLIRNKWSQNKHQHPLYYRYVRMMQLAIADSITQHQRGEDGAYGRRTGSRHVVHDVFLMPHLYGSLTQHREGFAALMQHEAVKAMVQVCMCVCVLGTKERGGGEGRKQLVFHMFIYISNCCDILSRRLIVYVKLIVIIKVWLVMFWPSFITKFWFWPLARYSHQLHSVSPYCSAWLFPPDTSNVGGNIFRSQNLFLSRRILSISCSAFMQASFTWPFYYWFLHP